MRVALGVTVLSRAAGACDGIGRYTGCLLHELSGSSALNLRLFDFTAGVSAIDGAFSAGSFQRQAMVALSLGKPFAALDTFAETVDLVHATDHFVPRLRNTPVVATVMDAIPLAHPEWVGYRFRRVVNHLWRRSIRWADHVVTISEFARSDIIRWFGISEDRVSVTPLGVDPHWFDPVATTEVDRVLAKYHLPDRYFLFVGTLQPRKNLARIIEAHRGLLPKVRTRHPLVIVGRYGWGCEDLRSALEREEFGCAVRWLRHVPDTDLKPILARATALVFTSLYEGFGLPLLEAFASGVPVISSTTTALPELSGEAAVLVDPADIAAIRGAMQQLACDSLLSAALVREGRARARRFSWAETARTTLDVYSRLTG